jgi:hypothetical protein
MGLVDAYALEMTLMSEADQKTSTRATAQKRRKQSS